MVYIFTTLVYCLTTHCGGGDKMIYLPFTTLHCTYYLTMHSGGGDIQCSCYIHTFDKRKFNLISTSYKTRPLINLRDVRRERI